MERLRRRHPGLRREAAAGPRGSAGGLRPATAPAQRERRIAALSFLAETIRAVAAAMAPLYAALPNEQERTADEPLAERSQDMRRRGP